MSDLNPMVTIQLGGKERHLLFTMNSFIAIEEKSGRDMLSEEGVPDKFTLRDVRLFAWAALLHEETTLTLEQVGAMVNFRNISTLTTGVLQALQAAMPKKEDGEVTGDRPLGQVQ